MSTKQNNLEQICVKIKINHKHLFLCAVYLPPDCDSSLYHTHISSVSDLINNCDINDEFLICGDYNLPGIQWNPDDEDGSLIPINVTSEKETSIADGMASLSLSQTNSLPNSRNVFLDLCFCSCPEKMAVHECSSPLLPLDVHHKSYEFKFSLEQITFHEQKEKTKQFNFQKADIPAILEYLNNVNWQILFKDKNIDKCVNEFYSVLDTCLDLFVPTFSAPSATPSHPWQSKKLKNLKNRRTRASKNRTSNRDRVYFEKLRAEYRALHRHEYESYLDNIENNIKNNPKKFFEFANYKKKTTGLPTSMTYNDESGDTPKKICELFANFFESVYENNSNQANTNNSSDFLSNNGFSTIQINMKDVDVALSKLNTNKGPGDDGIPPS